VVSEYREVWIRAQRHRSRMTWIAVDMVVGGSVEELRGAPQVPVLVIFKSLMSIGSYTLYSIKREDFTIHFDLGFNTSASTSWSATPNGRPSVVAAAQSIPWAHQNTLFLSSRRSGSIDGESLFALRW
jgi:hypothetical protein